MADVKATLRPTGGSHASLPPAHAGDRYVLSFPTGTGLRGNGAVTVMSVSASIFPVNGTPVQLLDANGNDVADVGTGGTSFQVMYSIIGGSGNRPKLAAGTVATITVPLDADAPSGAQYDFNQPRS